MTAALHQPSPPRSQASSRRTNCGKPKYRFGYGKHTITLTTPCFQHHCNTCASRQPAIGVYDASSDNDDDNNSSSSAIDGTSPHTTPATAEHFTASKLYRRKEDSRRAVDEKLRKISLLHVHNAPAVKLRKTRSGRVVKNRNTKVKNTMLSSPPPQRQKQDEMEMANTSRELLMDLDKGKLSEKQKLVVVLKFSDQLKRFAEMSKDFEKKKKAPMPMEGQKLFLIVGKGDTLRCEWR
ncbi:uncharacterized protein BKCO1_5500015 [Diplodia corticola]|uniref:Uncharacterized protein n=1 Tax=Diplodia corticola TaxID=236234 RepID=A0A1J9QR25_9PEZI|nr:uncharacterized protein BKCO1_5500015 [Diplodia corticola]OJD30865.1 hypothetical protein BKCO1_5500015 [Diplodia corticola]